MLPVTENPHLFRSLRRLPEAQDIDFNLVINWLKHPVGPESINIPEFEAAVAIARAITKFTAVYHESTRRFELFLQWGHEADYLPPLYLQASRDDTELNRLNESEYRGTSEEG
jgi:hypothetical protein